MQEWKVQGWFGCGLEGVYVCFGQGALCAWHVCSLSETDALFDKAVLAVGCAAWLLAKGLQGVLDVGEIRCWSRSGTACFVLPSIPGRLRHPNGAALVLLCQVSKEHP